MTFLSRVYKDKHLGAPQPTAAAPAVYGGSSKRMRLGSEAPGEAPFSQERYSALNATFCAAPSVALLPVSHPAPPLPDRCRVTDVARTATVAAAAGLPPLHAMAQHLCASTADGNSTVPCNPAAVTTATLPTAHLLTSSARPYYASTISTPSATAATSAGSAALIPLVQRASSAQSSFGDCGLPTLSMLSSQAGAPGSSPMFFPPASDMLSGTDSPLHPAAAALPATVAAGVPPSVLRDNSLGAAVAMALPDDLRQLALELVEPELQDQTIANAKEEIKAEDPQSRRGSPTADELECFLWDFIETSQALDEAHDLASAADFTLSRA